MSAPCVIETPPTDWWVEGYASVFGARDLMGDQVARGAFRQSLLDRSTKGVPMLMHHRDTSRIGYWTSLREDARGLLVRGRIEAAERLGKLAIAHLKARRFGGLSIGFRTRKSRRRPDGGRDLVAVELVEISLVTRPLLREAALIRAGPAGAWDTGTRPL